ncbi:DNA cross-link repair 1 protein-like isoform X4 [Agrilus planipennis]|uniref:DNA cross-link repair 1 protein-like isoform X3 n=1 Tax=Agrilus planipennis TaxID=224129 RepID=A0A1W4WTL9_AGRPL|nr:DNA cross-link repair 1 protein-like isoform X3 [Agrilus planipennis]XP_025830979.1 DNA cross-link repair 1 protein-like isoform X4 [Agrilus planipennis]
MLHLQSQIISFLLNLPRKSDQQNGAGFVWQSRPLAAANGELSNIIFDDSERNSKPFVPAQASRSINFEKDSSDFVFPSDDNNNNQNYPFQQQTNTNTNNENEGRQFMGNVPNTTPNRPGSQVSENARKICEQNCLSTSQYDPVCGDDQKTYHNEGKLRCAQRCGKNVRIISRVPCGK